MNSLTATASVVESLIAFKEISGNNGIKVDLSQWKNMEKSKSLLRYALGYQHASSYLKKTKKQKKTNKKIIIFF